MADDEADPSELFSSPIKPSDLPSRPRTPRTPKTPPPPTSSRDKEKEPFDAEEVREAALRRELEGVRNINEVIEGVIGTLEKAKGNMGSVSRTVDNASTLLNTWTRILSQTEHSQRLILNKDWNGSTRDLEAVEEDRLEQQLAAQRRAEAEDRRREEARRRAEEQERARLAGTTTTGRGRGVPGARGTRTTRARGVLRGGVANISGLDRGGASASSSRAGSQIGRGFGAGRTARGTRATGRGVR
ncbi:hypothetical protein M406DRAFT_342255 [Cryphonectria parasitica EP155]|uniref:DASH complex subunit DUO1 n=1 Tax=Cryphonectria parasitica (strain ATCC 38755 / EP155) TaxID=660469 RepID=A0A9P4XVE3_CRYP1|nr:uncharacterized protein M406DRAFT_342255 [Cryphonectria parasitica EP155]KAF3761470.1 hypothetical protein M406DRAFT_342255 [Cryphonectria parasitica EP155]